MCAINGITWEDRALVSKMNDAASHRGPDGTATVVLRGVTLGHNRLAIIDLDPRSNQPMRSPDGRYTIVFNGEIYNFKELREALRSTYHFTTESDTEVILAAYRAWGDDAFSKLNGIFALGLWDAHEEKLLLARDPAGIKPLYWTIHENQLLFSSELKPLLDAGVPRTLNIEAVQHYFRLLYVPQEMTLIQGIKKLLPGHVLKYRQGTVSEHSFTYTSQRITPVSYTAAVHDVRDAVSAAVERQLVSDRPVGMYLSGGIDSSTILAVATNTHPNINTYSVGFELDSAEEAQKFNADMELARRTAAHFGATHHEYKLRTDEIFALMPRMIRHHHSPVANATALAQLYLAEQTKETATVVLSGEGGDELFGGYERYRLALLASYIGPLSLRGVDRFAQLMFQKDAELILKHATVDITKDLFRSEFGGPLVESLMKTDERNWLVDEALVRADAMGMAASVEVRVPFLDLELNSLIKSLPRRYKVTPRTTKRVLRDAFHDLLPEEVMRQPKRGWFAPGAKWLRRPEFVEYADAVFRDDYTPAATLLNIPSLRTLWEAHREKRGYHYPVLWAALVFLAWTREYRVSV